MGIGSEKSVGVMVHDSNQLKGEIEEPETLGSMDVYFGQLQNKYRKCNDLKNKFCLGLRDGMHHFLTIEQVRLWVMTMVSLNITHFLHSHSFVGTRGGGSQHSTQGAKRSIG